MENNTGSLGPLPAAAPHDQLSPARATVRDALRAAGPLTLADLTTATGLHANTLREHLEGLVADGQVRRRRAEPHGRGRPAWLYSATGRGRTSGVAEYAGLAASLAEVISRTSPRPWDDAVEAGTGWGRTLVAPADLPPEQAREQVVELLGDLRFSPEVEGSEVRLTRCPLLDAAMRFPEVVCGVHLGIVRGALAKLGAPADGTTLRPFSEPGACRLSFAATP